MKDFCKTDFERAKKLYSSTPSSDFHILPSATERAICPGCGRDLSQPNLPPPSNSRYPGNQHGVSRGHGICSQCGGLEAGLLDELSG